MTNPEGLQNPDMYSLLDVFVLSLSSGDNM